jgi:hypothetical protein
MDTQEEMARRFLDRALDGASVEAIWLANERLCGGMGHAWATTEGVAFVGRNAIRELATWDHAASLVAQAYWANPLADNYANCVTPSLDHETCSGNTQWLWSLPAETLRLVRQSGEVIVALEGDGVFRVQNCTMHSANDRVRTAQIIQPMIRPEIPFAWGARADPLTRQLDALAESSGVREYPYEWTETPQEAVERRAELVRAKISTSKWRKR